MSRRRLSAADQLLDEARSIEVLLTEMAPPTESIQEYWEISLHLIDLVVRIEAYASMPSGKPEEEYQRLRAELSRVESGIMQLERSDE